MWGQILRGLAVSSGALLVAAAVAAISARNRKRFSRETSEKSDCGCGRIEIERTHPAVTSAQRRDYFQITRSRGISANQKWVLQGFGGYQCFLLFDSWSDAMEQATFRAESLASGKPQLIELH